MSVIKQDNIKVFISYSHDSPEHLEHALRLSDRLRRDGIDCIIDQYEMSPSEGWPRWTMSQVEEARFVLAICTEIYHRRVRGKEESGKGLGAKWEGAIITQGVYESESNNKFIPVLFSAQDSIHVPVYLRGVTHYVLDEEYENLYRRITDQPKHLKQPLGTLRSLPPLERKEDFLPVANQASKEKQNPPIKTQSRLRARWIVAALAGLVAFALILLWWSGLLTPLKADPAKSPDPPSIALYRVRVTVLDPQNAPVSDAVLSSLVGGEQEKADGGWEIDIPAANKPADGKVTIYASKRSASLYGEAELILDKDSNPAIKIQLRKGASPNPPIKGDDGPLVKIPPSSHIKGVVIDSSSQPIDGAWVNVVGYEGERVQTGPSGEFDLAAHRAKGQIVQVRAAKEGYKFENQNHPAGSIPMTIILRRGQ